MRDELRSASLLAGGRGLGDDAALFRRGLARQFEFDDQRKMIGGDSGKIGVRHLDIHDLDVLLDEDVVDALVDMIVSAPTREELVLRSRALDRVLQHGWYVVPNWHLAAWRVAYWEKFGIPETLAPYSLGVMDTWWAK